MAADTIIRRGAAALLVAGGLVLGAGCGGDEETADTVPVRPQASTATDQTTTSEQSETTETTETTTEETGSDNSGGVGPTETTETETTDDSGGGGVGPGYDPGQPDSEVNDVPPEAGTPQDKFEQYCAQHPDACG